ncbi:hypothetical protein KC19_VG119400 [Ceratodon purpureus]|uniref:Uncharacterized protein n=1 Tax=Ceratodon purpureus TaxID=3225 RepID=A0A8T0HP51_CERPU|nr:hypothetical protein KC19_VG119400 [Ceratodon purpureus]
MCFENLRKVPGRQGCYLHRKSHHRRRSVYPAEEVPKPNGMEFGRADQRMLVHWDESDSHIAAPLHYENHLHLEQRFYYATYLDSVKGLLARKNVLLQIPRSFSLLILLLQTTKTLPRLHRLADNCRRLRCFRL